MSTKVFVINEAVPIQKKTTLLVSDLLTQTLLAGKQLSSTMYSTTVLC